MRLIKHSAGKTDCTEQFRFGLQESVCNQQNITFSKTLHHLISVADSQNLNLQSWSKTQDFRQVFVNLLINAAHAIKQYNQSGNGVIKIETKPEMDYCVIKVSDNGSGISEELLSKIFDPFFTTKPVGQGTGLGLSISHNIIVDKHHGKIDVNSKLGIGTCFSISIPYTHEEQ